MDCAKVGKLILQLRKEKGLTQKQVADRLNISNKTISKWERGLGCPDVSLWKELSAILGADILHLLQGELLLNRPDTGKIDRTHFYVCPICRNILASTGKATISCCGRKLYSLIQSLPTENIEFSVKEVDTDLYIEFNHEMKKEHFILFVAYVINDSVFINRLYPEQNSSFRLPNMRSDGTLYMYCTKHGLQKFSNCLKLSD